MLFKNTIHSKLLSSAIIFSLPFLPLTGFFEKIRLNRDSSKSSKLFPKKFSSPHLISPGTDIGMWVWQRQYVVDSWECILMLDFCRLHGIKKIFTQVHFDKTEQGEYVLADREAWNSLLSKANALNVRVEALDGAGNMAFAINHEDTIARLKAVLDFNLSQTASARFSGFHYDIEPYTTSRWIAGEHKEIAVELLELLTKLRRVISEADPHLSFSNDIPFWYDSDEKFLIEFNGSKKYLNEHIQDTSDFIGIMSYRTEMTGENSTSEICSGELAYGAKIGRPVYLSLETVDLPETPQITFFGKSPVEVASAVRELSAALENSRSFGGVYLHEYNTLRLIGDKWNLSEINF